jgi:hypothetical protein
MRILICPLDWGLGHATRCIPLIRALRRNHEVVIGAGGLGRRLLSAEFPEAEVFDFPGYRVRYSRHPLLFLPFLLLQAPFLLAGLMAERRRLERIVAERKIDLVISDGRYGCRAAGIPSILITHQIFIRVPGGAVARKLLFALNARLLGKFREIWVPDVAAVPNLSGELGHGRHGLEHLVHIGPLSRFPSPETAVPGPAALEIRGGKPLIVAATSGPEPQRTLFEAALRRELERMEGTRVLVRGLPGGPAFPRSIAEGGFNEFDHLDGPALEALFKGAHLVIARSGYTTVMEMAALGIARAVLVPTPGQSEQEYLADHLQSQGVAQRMDQNALDLEKAMSAAGGYSGFAGFLPEEEKNGSSALEDFLSGHPILGADAAHIC